MDRVDFVMSKIALDYDINVVYDVGAHVGDFTKKLKTFFKRGTEYHMFEGSPTKTKADGGKWHKVLLSDKDDVTVDFYHDGGTGDTYYRETDEYLKSDYKISKLTTKRLDTYVRENGLPLPDLIKIDVQGAELDVLRGCDEILEHCKVIHCEIPAEGIEFNRGSPTQEEYLEFFEGLGFTNKEFIKDHRRDGTQIIQHDYVFTKGR